MSHTSRITKDMHIHTPLLRSLMTYTTKEGVKKAHVLNLDEKDAIALMIRTTKWAARNGIEVHIRPC
jgi:hypothetical protein